MRIGIALATGDDRLRSVEVDAYRFSRLEREQRQRSLHRQLVLAAETAAGRAGDDADSLLRHGEDARKLEAVARAMLAADADGERAIGLRHNVATFGFHETMKLSRRDVHVLDDVSTSVPGLVNVAASEP